MSNTLRIVVGISFEKNLDIAEETVGSILRRYFKNNKFFLH